MNQTCIPKYRKFMDSSQGLKSIKTTIKDGPRFKEEQEQPLSPMARLFHEPGSNIYIITMMGCKTKINPDVIKENMVHSLLGHPRFSSLQVTFMINSFVATSVMS